MKQIAEKLAAVAQAVIREKGSLDFFALWQREDSPDASEVIFSAKWAEADEGEAVIYIANLVTAAVSRKELRLISRVAIARNAAASLGTVVRGEGEIRMQEFSNFTFRGVPILHAYIILLRLPSVRKSRASA